MVLELLFDLLRGYIFIILFHQRGEDLGAAVHHFLVANFYLLVQRRHLLLLVELGGPYGVHHELLQGVPQRLRQYVVNSVDFLIIFFEEDVAGAL